jgi:hypothetical protein
MHLLWREVTNIRFFCDAAELETSYSVANCFNIAMKVENFYVFDTV